MADIADKFGKASVSTNYALATTVKTARTVGEAVLACYDLSKFSTSTPVFFVTYKKTTDPVTGNVSVTNQTSWKAIVNPDNNTLTNLTLAPGYVDIGHDIGDFVECIPTSYWGNELIEGIEVHANPDGTLKTSAVQAALNISDTSPNWTVLANPPSTITNNGNRSYNIVFDGIDYTDRLSPGTRLRTTRTVAAPTQCTSLNGTTQYYNKTSPVGMTFTDDFATGAWVKLTSYQAGVIISRYNGTSGWCLDIDIDGRVALAGFNGGGGNYSYVKSYQSLPLNKWVHVGAQLDMSAFTASTTTSYIMFDGIDIPSTVVRSGTNPTTLIQAGALEIGTRNGGTIPFAGKIAQAFVSSAKITQDNIRSIISQGLTSSLITTHNIISAYSFDNSINDLNISNANNLTPQGSAVATNTDSPFGVQASGLISSTLDYGIIQSVTFSTNTTAVVQVPEGNTIPTSGGVNSVSYSGIKAPYGMPIVAGKWQVRMVALAPYVYNVASATTYYVTPMKLTIPIGEWTTSYQVAFRYGGSSSAGAINGVVGLTSLTANYGGVLISEYHTHTQEYTYPASGIVQAIATVYKRFEISSSSAIVYSLSGRVSEAAGSYTFTFMAGPNSITEITAENAYL